MLFVNLCIIVYLALVIIIYALSSIDYFSKKTCSRLPTISVFIPCYNDADTLSSTVKSLYAAYQSEKIELFLINDKSTDDSESVMKKIKREHPKATIHVISNSKNMGKTLTLNSHILSAKNELIFILDADMRVTQRALHDVLARLETKTVGAVSCPYVPRNRGFFGRMQTLEYQMLSFTQVAYNITSVLSIWGGFIGVKKKALVDVGLFTPQMLTEDIDLAFKLNKKNWRVQQSFISVQTHVPLDFWTWVKQKIRWSAGAGQCYIKYPGVWLKNPIQQLLVISLCLMLIVFVSQFFSSIIFINNFYDYYISLVKSIGFSHSLDTIVLAYGGTIIKDVLWKLAFTLIALPYSFPLIKRWVDLPKLLYIVPFTLIYMPLFIVVTSFGICKSVLTYRSYQKGKRAW